ncbi:MAG: permease [Phycisphaerae bacterium]
MSLRNEWKKLLLLVAVFLAFFWLPVGWERFTGGIMEALRLTKWYAREHVLLCLVPAFFIAGAIAVFISQASVMKYLGAKAHKVLAYGVASVSGSILAVCSCTVLPLFAGIWRMGAGLGPATAFLYSGPAINVLAIILTARILGPELGIARAVGAIGFSVVIGLIMHFIYRREELEKANGQADLPEPEVSRPLWKNAVFFAVMIGVLVFANWGAPGTWDYQLPSGESVRVDIAEAPFDPHEPEASFTLRPEAAPADGSADLKVPAERFLENRQAAPGFWSAVWQSKWLITAAFGVGFALVLIFWLSVAWWKVALAAIPPVILASVLPTEGLWVLLPFSAAILGVSMVLETSKGEGEEWFEATWGFAKQILPLLFFGVIVAGFLLGRPGHPGLIPSRYVEMLVGDSPDAMLTITGWGGGGFESVARGVWPLWTNFFASVFGAFMYFATLTEVPILQGLIGAGMGRGPALALLLAGPALSLPNMLVIRSVMGTRKTIVFCSLVVVMSTTAGIIFGTGM